MPLTQQEQSTATADEHTDDQWRQWWSHAKKLGQNPDLRHSTFLGCCGARLLVNNALLPEMEYYAGGKYQKFDGDMTSTVADEALWRKETYTLRTWVTPPEKVLSSTDKGGIYLGVDSDEETFLKALDLGPTAKSFSFEAEGHTHVLVWREDA